MRPFRTFVISIVILWSPAEHYTLYKEIQLIIYSYNMGTSDFLDMHAQSPRATGIHIRQTTSAHVTAIMLHSNKADSLNANANVPNH